MKRIVAANRVALDGDTTLKPGFVALEGDRVVCTGRLDDEQPFTEWLGGTIVVRSNGDGTAHAYKDGRMLAAM